LEGDVELWQPCLFTLQKFKQPMLVEMHDVVAGNDDNDNPPPTKICKFQLLSILQYVSGSLYMLQFNITFVIFFHSSFCMIFDIFFVGHDVAQGSDLSLTTYQRAHHLFHTSFQGLKRRLCNLLK